MNQTASERIEEIRNRIRTGDYQDTAEKHELHKQRWLLQKELDGVIVPAISFSDDDQRSE